MTSPGDRNIDMRQLRYFVAVAQESSFRRAAERLHLTQPPLSRQIAALESALGARLFERSKQAVRLTPAGEVALREFSQLLARFEQSLRRVVAAESTAPRRLRVGVLWWADLSAFARFERALERSVQVDSVEPVVAPSAELIERMQRGLIEAAMVVLPHSSAGLALHAIARARHVALIPSGDPLARRRSLRLSDLQQLEPFLRFRRRENPALYDHFSALYAAARFEPARVEPAQGTVATLSQIAAGRGCTIAPQAMARRAHPGVAARRLIDDVFVDVALAVPERLPAPLRNALRDAAPLLAAAVN